MSAMVQLAQSGDIVLKARGMVISRAVDVAEIVTKRLGNNYLRDSQRSRSTQRKLGEGEDIRNVSTIEIVIAKKRPRISLECALIASSYFRWRHSFFLDHVFN